MIEKFFFAMKTEKEKNIKLFFKKNDKIAIFIGPVGGWSFKDKLFLNL